MKKIGKLVYKIQEIVRKGIYKLFRENAIKCSLGSCGKHVHIGEHSDIKGNENIYIGDDTAIASGSLLWSTRAKIIFEGKTIVGPNLSIITGNHRVNLVGKYMCEITDDEKELTDDMDVVINKDVWIGANVTILKGVTIAEGCVIGGGAVVTKSTEPYGIYGGVPAKRIKDRFTSNKIIQHK